MEVPFTLPQNHNYNVLNQNSIHTINLCYKPKSIFDAVEESVVDDELKKKKKKGRGEERVEENDVVRGGIMIATRDGRRCWKRKTMRDGR